MVITKQITNIMKNSWMNSLCNILCCKGVMLQGENDQTYNILLLLRWSLFPNVTVLSLSMSACVLVLAHSSAHCFSSCRAAVERHHNGHLLRRSAEVVCGISLLRPGHISCHCVECSRQSLACLTRMAYNAIKTSLHEIRNPDRNGIHPIFGRRACQQRLSCFVGGSTSNPLNSAGRRSIVAVI